MISNERKLIDFISSQYANYKESLTEISKNGSNLFIDMPCEFVHFDKVPMLLNQVDSEGNCFSVDTIIYCDKKNCIYLIEFKEGWPKGDSAKELRFKCYDTISKLVRHWSLNLGGRQDFFSLKIKYAVITRPPAGNDSGEINESFLDVLNGSKSFFKLKVLQGTLVDDVSIFVEDEKIFKFLNRITNHQSMNYYHKGQKAKTEWSYNPQTNESSHSVVPLS